jgi:hypothetical protein
MVEAKSMVSEWLTLQKYSRRATDAKPCCNYFKQPAKVLTIIKIRRQKSLSRQNAARNGGPFCGNSNATKR